MKFLFLITFFFFCLPIFAQETKPEEKKPDDELDFKIQRADVSLSFNYRSKTTRELTEPDIPNISYSTEFYFPDFSIGLDYGYFPFKSSEQRQIQNKMLTTSLNTFQMIAEKAFFMGSLNYTYYTDANVPSEYILLGGIGYSLWKFTARIGGYYDHIAEVDYIIYKQPGRDQFDCNFSLEFMTNLGVYLNSNSTYATAYSIDPNTYEFFERKYLKQTVGFGFRRNFAAGFAIYASFSKDWAFKTRENYPFDLKTAADPLTISMLMLNINLTKKGDVVLSLRIRNIKGIEQDFYYGAALNVGIGGGKS